MQVVTTARAGVAEQEEAAAIKTKKEKAEKKSKKMAKLNGKYPFVKFYQAPTKMYDVLEDAKENSDQNNANP